MAAIQELRQSFSQPLTQPPIRESLSLPARRLETPGSIFHEYLSKFDARHNPFSELKSPVFSQNYYPIVEGGYHFRVYTSLRDKRTEYLPTILPYSHLYLQAYRIGKDLDHMVQLSDSDALPIIFDSFPFFRWDSSLRCPTATLPEIKGPTLEALKVYNKVSAYRDFQDQIAHMNCFTLPDRAMASFSPELLESLAVYNHKLNSRLGYGQAVEIAAEDVVVSTDKRALFVYNLHPKQ